MNTVTKFLVGLAVSLFTVAMTMAAGWTTMSERVKAVETTAQTLKDQRVETNQAIANSEIRLMYQIDQSEKRVIREFERTVEIITKDKADGS